jgi:hypothetical protein
MDEITKQIFLEKIKVCIDDYKSHADELFKLINIHFDQESDRLKNISILFLQRYYSGLISISTLIQEFKFYKSIEFTYSLIIRTLLLDFITLEYLRFQKGLGQDCFKKSLEQINYLSADDSNRYCDNLIEHKEGFRNHIALHFFPENFEKDLTTGNSTLKKTKPLQPWKMAVFFKDKPEPYAYDAYKLYNHYSLIEHFNNLTFDAMQGDEKSDIVNLIWSMFYIFQGHHTCLDILDFFPKHSPEILEYRSYFLDLTKQVK